MLKLWLPCKHSNVAGLSLFLSKLGKTRGSKGHGVKKPGELFTSSVMCLWLSQPHGFQTWFVATVQEVTRGCRYAACRGGVLSGMCGPNSHAATSERRYESSAGENDCAASRRKPDRGVNQLLVHSGSYLRARLPSSEHSHPFTPSWEVWFFSGCCFFLNTVSIIMLRVPSRGMIILSYYRLPDAAHTFPLPLLEGEKKHSSCFSGTICKEKITDPR